MNDWKYKVTVWKGEQTEDYYFYYFDDMDDFCTLCVVSKLKFRYFINEDKLV